MECRTFGAALQARYYIFSESNVRKIVVNMDNKPFTINCHSKNGLLKIGWKLRGLYYILLCLKIFGLKNGSSKSSLECNNTELFRFKFCCFFSRTDLFFPFRKMPRISSHDSKSSSELEDAVHHQPIIIPCWSKGSPMKRILSHLLYILQAIRFHPQPAIFFKSQQPIANTTTSTYYEAPWGTTWYIVA